MRPEWYRWKDTAERLQQQVIMLMENINLHLVEQDNLTTAQGNLLVAQGLLTAAVSDLGLVSSVMETAIELEAPPIQQQVAIGDSSGNLSDTLVPEAAEITQGD
jgi:hypothetical protein